MVTTVKIHEDTKRALDRMREHPDETYDHVIRKLVTVVKDDEGELRDEVMAAIEAARERMARGEYVTMDEARKRLDLKWKSASTRRHTTR